MFQCCIIHTDRKHFLTVLSEGSERGVGMKTMAGSHKLIIASWLVAVFSLFLTWVDAFFVKADGFQQQGYIFLIFFLYPLLVALRKQRINKVVGYISSSAGLLAIVYFISTKSMEAFGEKMHFASIGMYVFLLATIGLIVGVYLDKTVDAASEKDVEGVDDAISEASIPDGELAIKSNNEKESVLAEEVVYGPKPLKVETEDSEEPALIEVQMVEQLPKTEAETNDSKEHGIQKKQ